MSEQILNILVVDDEHIFCQNMKKILDEEGFKTFCAYNGSEAHNILRENDIHFVISDIRMPDKNGLHLLKWIKRKMGDKIPVLMISAYSDVPKNELTSNGAIDLFLKPVDYDKIIECILKHCKRPTDSEDAESA